jgi:hypothetical protein
MGILLVALFPMTGCDSTLEVPRDIGALRVTEYWGENRWRWEGSNSFFIERMTICVRASGVCIEDHGLHIQPQDWKVSHPRWILVSGASDEGLERFYDTTTGAVVPCPECGSGPTRLRWRGLISWSGKGDTAISLLGDTSADQLTIGLIRFSESVVTLERISLDLGKASAERPTEPRISPDGSAAAWLACAATCVVHSYEFASRRHRQKDTGCPDHSHLEFVWIDGKPQARYAWGAALGDAQKTLCRKANGELALPIGPRP